MVKVLGPIRAEVVERRSRETAFEYDAADFSTDTTLTGSVSLAIVEVVPSSGKVLGIVENQTSETVFGPISVLLLCFDEQDSIVGYANAFADRDELGSGSIDLAIRRHDLPRRVVRALHRWRFRLGVLTVGGTWPKPVSSCVT